MFDVLEKKTRPRGRDDSHVAEVFDLIVGSLISLVTLFYSLVNLEL